MEILKEKITVISKLIILCLITLIIMSAIYHYKKNYFGYEYLTMNDDFGVANHCYMNNKGLYCLVAGKLVEVKQYRKR